MPFPKWFVEKPQVPMGSEIILLSYWDLDSCRQVGFGSGMIPWTAIHDYCIAHGITGYRRYEFFKLIRALDNEHLKYNQEKLAETGS